MVLDAGTTLSVGLVDGMTAEERTRRAVERFESYAEAERLANAWREAWSGKWSATVEGTLDIDDPAEFRRMVEALAPGWGAPPAVFLPPDLAPHASWPLVRRLRAPRVLGLASAGRRVRRVQARACRVQVARWKRRRWVQRMRQAVAL